MKKALLIIISALITWDAISLIRNVVERYKKPYEELKEVKKELETEKTILELVILSEKIGEVRQENKTRTDFINYLYDEHSKLFKRSEDRNITLSKLDKISSQMEILEKIQKELIFASEKPDSLNYYGTEIEKRLKKLGY